MTPSVKPLAQYLRRMCVEMVRLAVSTPVPNAHLERSSLAEFGFSLRLLLMGMPHASDFFFEVMPLGSVLNQDSQKPFRGITSTM
jgi:hypothetical protein